jgi:hypothetical protein
LRSSGAIDASNAGDFVSIAAGFSFARVHSGLQTGFGPSLRLSARPAGAAPLAIATELALTNLTNVVRSRW